MLSKTNGIVLRSVKYGDSSLITTLFTEQYGVQSYLVQGVRSAKASKNRAGFFQPGVLLELVVYHQPGKNLQRLREFQPAYLYGSLQENIIKNSILLFSVELLLRLLPEGAPMTDLFEYAFGYFITLDQTPVAGIANFPLFFIIRCSGLCGFDLKGTYSEDTPHLNFQEGGFTATLPTSIPFTKDEDARALDRILQTTDFEGLKAVEMNAATRLRLIDWYIGFLQSHSQHMGNIRSLPVLQMVLHG